MKVIIVGCGRVGAELAYRLYQRGHKVSVMDHSMEAFKNLPADFQGKLTEGDALNQDALHRAEIETADALAVVTNSDSLNAVIAHVARTSYAISNVVVRNYDPSWRSLLEGFDLQLISSSSWGAQRIEELLYHAEMRTVFSAGNGEVEIYEFSIPEGWEGRPLKELLPAEDCIAVGLTRAGRAILPQGDTMLNKNDILLVSATCDGIETVRQRLNSKKEG